MNKNFKKIALSIISVLLSFIFVFSVAASVPTEVSKSELDKKKAEIRELENLLYEKNKNMSALQEQIDEYKNEIQKSEDEKVLLINKVQTLNDQINTTQQIIDNYELYIDMKEKEIAESEAELAERESMLVDYLRYEYEQGAQGIQYIEFLLSSASLADFLANIHYIGSMLDYQKYLMDDMGDAIIRLDSQKADLSAAQAAQMEHKATLEATVAETEILIEEVEQYVIALDQSVADAEDEYDFGSDEFDSLSSDILAEKEELEKLQADYDAYQAYLEEQRRQKEEEERRKAEAEKNKLVYSNDGKYLLPINASKSFRISTWYGYEPNPLGSGIRFHKGVDFAMAGGSDIYAVASGVVTTAKYSSSYGYYVVILHNDGTSSLYAHARKLLVEKGDRVTQGDVIAYVGTTGWSTGNHLHYEFILSDGSTRIDPMYFYTSIYKSHYNDSTHNNSLNDGVDRAPKP